MTVDFGIATQVEGSEAVLVLSGEIDYGNVARLRTALVDLASGGADQVSVDMAGVAFLDSTVLSVLVQGKQRLNDSGRQVNIVNPQPRVRRILELAGVLDYLQA